MDAKVKNVCAKVLKREDLSFDSPFYAEWQFAATEELINYEALYYADKPAVVREIEKEISYGAFGKYSLSEEKQKIYNDYTRQRTEKDPVLRMKARADDFIEGLTYVQTVLARQYEKLLSQKNGEALIEDIRQKAGGEDELDPFLLLVTRTNALKEFREDYLSRLGQLEKQDEQSEEYKLQCLALADGDDVSSHLLQLYAKLFEFADLFYRNNLKGGEGLSPDVFEKEVADNQLFIKKNQETINKLIRPKYVALEHSKLVAVTKQIMDAVRPVTAIRVDGKGTKVSASISTDEGHQGLRIDSFDTLVEEAIGCLLDNNAATFQQNGYMDMPLSAIAQQVLILNPNAHISKEQGRSITDSMNKLRHIFVKVDFRAQAIAHKKLGLDAEEATLEDNALNYTKTTVNYRGNAIEVYRIHSYPPRYRYSKAVRQISGISRDLICLPNMNITRGVAVLRRYLVEYIEGIKGGLSSTVFFATVNKACEGNFAYESKESRRDFRNKVTAILDGFKDNGYIEDYSVVKVGRELKGVNIVVQKAESK